jgi:hypothetical protein
MLKRFAAWWSIVALAGISCGCATEDVNNSLRNMIGTLTGQPVDSLDQTKDEKDGWNDVGKDARASQAPIQDNDPMRNLLVSPRAQEIERSLGVN